MKIRLSAALLCAACMVIAAGTLAAQDASQNLGPHFQKIKEGIYVERAQEANSNCGIILTKEGVVLVDSGHNPTDSREVLAAVKKLTPLPIRYLIDTEVHPDHTTGHFVFSPPTVVIAHEGTGEAMKKAFDPQRLAGLIKQMPEIAAAAQGYQLVTPQIEYRGKMTLHLGERTLELINLHNVHSEADTAVWLPQERVIFSASVAIPKSFNNIRNFVTFPDMLTAIRMMKSLNPEVVIPGHGSPGTTQIFDDNERLFTLLVDRVGKMVKEGKTLDQIKQELKLPEYDDWAAKERIPTNIEAAYRAVKAGG